MRPVVQRVLSFTFRQGAAELAHHSLASHDIPGAFAASVTAGREAEKLAAPADAFVADFVGADRALKRLALSTAAKIAVAGEAPSGAPTIAPTTSLREALSIMPSTPLMVHFAFA